MKLRRLSTAARGFDAKLNALTRYEASADAKVQKTVARILADVRARGDAAVLAYAKRFDKSTARSMEMPRRSMRASTGTSGRSSVS